MKKALQFLRKNPEIIFFIGIFIIWTALMCNENAKEGGDFKWHDLKVEANGMIFDLFVFGILVTVYNAIRARREKIERLKEEIDDYRGWNEKEATFRIVGAVKRLNRLGVIDVDLYGSFLPEAYLTELNLSGAKFQMAKLMRAFLTLSDFSGANFKVANLSNAQMWQTILVETDLEGASLMEADLMEADLTRASLKSANLSEANLAGANLTEAKLEKAMVGKNWFEKLEKWKVKGREKIIIKYLIDEKGRLQLK